MLPGGRPISARYSIVVPERGMPAQTISNLESKVFISVYPLDNHRHVDDILSHLSCTHRYCPSGLSQLSDSRDQTVRSSVLHSKGCLRSIFCSSEGSSKKRKIKDALNSVPSRDCFPLCRRHRCSLHLQVMNPDPTSAQTHRTTP